MTPEASVNHNKLIATAAKQALAPLGLKRAGKSRLWYDDRGWWCIIVEFQPSSWSKGTYLNVGASFLLFERAHWGFHVGHREQGFSPVRREQQFNDALAAITAHAVDRVQHYREKFATVRNANLYYQSTELRSHWDYYHAGVFALLDGNSATARKCFDLLFSQTRPYGWQKGLYYRAMDLSRIMENRTWSLESIAGVVLRTRDQLLLEDRDSHQLGLPMC